MRGELHFGFATVEDIDAAVEFFVELGLQLEGRAPNESAAFGCSPACADRRLQPAAAGAIIRRRAETQHGGRIE